METLKKIYNYMIDNNLVNEDILCFYTNINGFTIESLMDIDDYYDLSAYDDELYKMLYDNQE